MTEIDIVSDQEQAERGGTAATDLQLESETESHADFVRLSKGSGNHQRSLRAKGAAPLNTDLQRPAKRMADGEACCLQQANQPPCPHVPLEESD